MRRIGKRLWRLIASAEAVALLLAALGIGIVPSQARYITVPAPGGRYSEGLVGIPQYPIPLLARTQSERAMVALLFMGLTSVDGSGQVHPALAESWTSTPDGKSYTFSLRHNITWHDGQPFTAADVVYTYNALTSPDNQGPYAGAWNSFVLQKLDEFTVRFLLQAPLNSFLEELAIGIMPRHLLQGIAVKDIGASAFNTAPAGTGPFKLGSYTAQQAVLAANKDAAGRVPYLDELRLRFYSDSAALRAAYERGEVDGMAQVDPVTVAQLQRDKSVVLHSGLLNEYVAVLLNVQTAPFADKLVRQALNVGIDRTALVARTIGGQGEVASGPFAPSLGPGAISQKADPYDQAKAIALLDQAGWKLGATGVRQRGGQPLAFTLLTNKNATRLAIARDIAGQLGQLGIQVQVQQRSLDTLVRENLARRAFQAALIGQQLNQYDPDISALWSRSATGAGGLNFSGYLNPVVDELLATGRTSNDPAIRQGTYTRLQAIFTDDVPTLFLYYPRYIYVTNLRLKGLPMREALPLGLLLDDAGRFASVRNWYMNEKRVEVKHQ